MEKDKLEEFVNKNREAFELFEPDPSIWLGVVDEQAKVKPQSLWKNRKNWMVAASIAIIVTCSYFVGYYSNRGHARGNDIALNAVTQPKDSLLAELMDAQAYYSVKIADRLNKVEVMTAKMPEEQKEFKGDLKELDSALMELKEDLKENVDNKDVIEAMINNYRLKLEILEDLLQKLDAIKKEDTDTHIKNKHYEI